MEYKTVKTSGIFKYEVERSKFIARTKSVADENEARSFIAEIKKLESLATHNCYAYIVDGGNYQRYSDDGEPNGTAGAPILECVKQAELVNTAVVVTRYFGGIKLGTGGLSRAYSKAASGAINESGAARYVLCGIYTACLSYEENAVFLSRTKPFKLYNLSFGYGDKIDLRFGVEKDDADKLCELFSDMFKGKIQPTLSGEEYLREEK